VIRAQFSELVLSQTQDLREAQDNQKHLVHNINNLTSFKLRLTDEDGDLIDFNEVHYSLTLEISIVSI
jgi:hypothetical protein